jgi:RNA recognition motif-containing protein
LKENLINFKDEIQSKVLYLRGILNEEINFQILYNIFSNYGNICKMLMIRVKNTALIEFEDVPSAKIAKDHLNNIKILGSQIKVFHSLIFFFLNFMNFYTKTL